MTGGSSSWWTTTWRCVPTASAPNALRARAYDLKEWLTFLRLLDIAPLAAVPEHVDQFAGWLRRPVGPGQLRPVNADDGPSREATTANRILNSVYMFYEFLARPRRRHGRPAGTAPAGTSPAITPASWPVSPSDR